MSLPPAPPAQPEDEETPKFTFPQRQLNLENTMGILTGDWIRKGSGATAYSAEFGRGGNAATFLAQVLDISGATPPSLLITVEHKNRDDTTWGNLVTFTALTAAGIGTKDATGIKELCRFTFTITATNSWEGHLVLIPAPAWRPY